MHRVVALSALLIVSCAPTAELRPSVPPTGTVPATPAAMQAAQADRRSDAASPTAAPKPTAGEELRVSTAGWKTDFSKRSAGAGEIMSGGPPKDGIPPIDRPKFISPAEAGGWLADNEPVVAFEEQGEARAYPLQILIWHEIVNDEVAGRPVAVTFCPLCNTAIAFDRRLEARVLDFGTTGNLRYSDLVMYDRQTESWWQQITGEAIVGELTGERLQPLAAPIVSFADFKRAHPSGQVLSRETGFVRSYGRNPYAGYDNVDSSPFLFRGPSDGRLRPMERVVTVSLNGEDAAYPFALLEQRGVVQDRVGGQPIAVFFAKGTASALDAESIPASRDIGATGVFRPVVEGRALSFKSEAGRVVDAETGSTWSILGRATGGPLAGKRLEPVIHGTHFWFAWAVFRPATRVWRPD